jgi:hypothetical protein
MDKLLVQLRAQNKFRNALVHGAWGGYLPGSGGGGTWQKIGVHPASLKMRSEDFTVNLIDANRKQLVPLGVEMTNLVQTIMKERMTPLEAPPSHDTPPPPLPKED